MQVIIYKHTSLWSTSICMYLFLPCRRRWRPVRHASPIWSYSSSSSRWCSLKALRMPRHVPCSASWSTSYSPSWPSSWCLCPPWLTAWHPWWKLAAVPSLRSSCSCSSPCSGGTGTHSQDTHFAFCMHRDDDVANLIRWCFENQEATAESQTSRDRNLVCENKLPFLKEKVYTFTFWKNELSLFMRHLFY